MSETRRTLGKWMVTKLLPRLDGRKTQRWAVWNHSGACLGVVKWEGTWRQYVFWPEPSTIWAASCLSDLAEFVRELNEAQKAGRET